ncbi:MAG: tRNA pseudouridine(38-40) synthase TruA [Porticoccaceae bacterium]|nr:tRNA pseudouridine(38-40) synthase TruA [Porticoccaceae bacterium]|tara:strand:+ start:1172 stop:2044 length:873 start_codon:yes stop_codon:yes gene_type:complete
MSEWHYTPNALVHEEAAFPLDLKRYAAIVSYDGSNYCGFQRQKHSHTVQAELESALSFVAGAPVIVAPAGRTDSGVHGDYQVVHFDSQAVRSGQSWIRGGNSKLPDSVNIKWAGEVSPKFHSRFSALSRTYRYVVANTPTKPAILANFVTWVKSDLDVQSMAKSCHFILGERDFSCFRGAACQSHSSYRRVISANIFDCGDLLVFEIKANAFLLHMVRNIMAALLEVGAGRRSADWISRLIEHGDRSKAPATASPNGLFLVGVEYPTTFRLPEFRAGPIFLNGSLDVPVY